MPPLSLLIKPASGICDLDCTYCFYHDIMNKREQESYGFMKPDTLEQIIRKALDYAEGSCTFGFQGGEPILAGLDFFKKVIFLQREYQQKNPQKNLLITNTVQTNGRRIDKEWAAFLKENQFLVGISLDGTRDTHDRYRRTPAGKGTFQDVINAIRLFNEYQVEYNVLTVVNRDTAAGIKQIYDFYKEQGFDYLQFIPCLDPFEEKRGGQEYSLTPKLYGQFLCEFFDLWYEDMNRGKPVYIRQFENYILMLLGNPAESCDMNGHCSLQHVIESNGNVYPCDFFVMDRYLLGNIREHGFPELRQRYEDSRFYQESLDRSDECSRCKYFCLCRNGCKRNRIMDEQGQYQKNYFCDSYKMFFGYCMERLIEIAKNIAASFKE